MTKQSEKGLGVVSNPNEWRRFSLAVDSGACVTVADPDTLPNYMVYETPQSKAGEEFSAASGDGIPNLGAMRIPVVTRENTQRLMNITAAPVVKPLMSVKQLCAMGHIVLFDDDGSFILNKVTGELNQLREENGNYMMDCWVPPTETGFGGQP